MSQSAAKASRRQIRRAFGNEFQEAVEVFMLAHEEGLKTHGEILKRTVLAGFWGRLRWLLFGVPVDDSFVTLAFQTAKARIRTALAWRSLKAEFEKVESGPPHRLER